MSKPVDAYPDISDILQRKAEGRKESAGRTLGEKIARMEAMRERLRPLKRLRETRQGLAAGSGTSQTSKTK
jgi:ribosomal protein L19E